MRLTNRILLRLQVIEDFPTVHFKHQTGRIANIVGPNLDDILLTCLKNGLFILILIWHQALVRPKETARSEGLQFKLLRFDHHAVRGREQRIIIGVTEENSKPGIVQIFYLQLKGKDRI